MTSPPQEPASERPPEAGEPRRLRWARELQALAQTGLTYATDPYDIERYHAARALAVEMLAATGAAEETVIAGLFKGETGYATPKVDVRGAVFQGCEGGAEQILLVREVTDGKWALPGGWADVNASPRENVEREIFEESGFEAKVTKLAAVYDRLKHPHSPPHPFHIYKMFFICTLTGGSAKTSVETSEIGFFGEDDLPELSQGRVLESQIRRMFVHQRDSSLPADFD